MKGCFYDNVSILRVSISNLQRLSVRPVKPRPLGTLDPALLVSGLIMVKATTNSNIKDFNVVLLINQGCAAIIVPSSAITRMNALGGR